ncbi:MAG: FAD-binding oxidoreductase, partial [Chromatiales bacterium]|nr:FAD-binding oxidoreductase [Chromatiales bacterium]
GVAFREQGYLVLATEASLPVLTSNHALQRAEGADIISLQGASLQARFPWLNMAGLVGGFFGASNEGWVDPYMLLQAYRRKARSLGVEFVSDEALHIEHEGGLARAVRLRGAGRIGAGVVLNSAGASGSRALARSLGVDIPIESRLRTTFVFECRDDLADAPLTILPNGSAWRPEGTRHIATLAPPPERDPERFDFDLDHDQFEAEIWAPLAAQIPAFEAIKVVHAYCCHYDLNTLDENAIIGLLPGFSNAYLAAGFSGHGMQQSPAVGRALTELIVHGEFRTLDLSRFGYGRVVAGEGIHESNCW